MKDNFQDLIQELKQSNPTPHPQNQQEKKQTHTYNRIYIGLDNILFLKLSANNTYIQHVYTVISGPGFDRKPKAYEDHLLNRI